MGDYTNSTKTIIDSSDTPLQSDHLCGLHGLLMEARQRGRGHHEWVRKKLIKGGDSRTKVI